VIAALPPAAIFVAGRSLAGVHLGDTAGQVRARFGADYGVCRGCATTTWYFTYQRFDDKGVGVELTGGRVSAVYTLWQPQGWRGPGKLGLGAVEGQVTAAVGAVVPVACSGYTALVAGTSAYFIVDGKLWGFGLFRKGRSPCR
jgi:hypothetical protein